MFNGILKVINIVTLGTRFYINFLFIINRLNITVIPNSYYFYTVNNNATIITYYNN